MKEKGIFYKWKENVKTRPIWDEDNFVLNYLAPLPSIQDPIITPF
jgi:hypothetical protein